MAESENVTINLMESFFDQQFTVNDKDAAMKSPIGEHLTVSLITSPDPHKVVEHGCKADDSSVRMSTARKPMCSMTTAG